ncbi:MAG: glycosyltransferase [Clostridia bacterium]|nr:glycosyltransferase [Clostridia bacterium]
MSNLISKAVSAIKNKGIVETVKIGFRYVKLSLDPNGNQLVILNNIVNENSFKNVIVFENNFGWTKIMKQRPQQIAENLPADTLMFYHSNHDADFDSKRRVRKLKDNLVLIDLGYYRDALLEKLKKCPNRYMMVYSTDYIDMERIDIYDRAGYYIIYEYVDDINRDLVGNDLYKLLSERHQKLMEMSNLSVICTATELKNKLEHESALITNGVNYSHFKKASYPVPEDLAPIKKDHGTVICYYGAIASWFDYGLVKKLAENDDYGIVLIGLDYDNTLEKSGLLDVKNVYYLGRKDYEVLPAYGNNADILVIPFVNNSITKATSPVKIFEYMAMEKPIVTTDLPECRKYRSVLVSGSEEEFIENVKKAEGLENDEDYISTEIAEAKANDWSIKASELLAYVDEQKNTRFERDLRSALEGDGYDRVVVWRSPFGWDVPLFQRPQHIARQLAKKGCVVFYEITENTDCVDEMRKEEDNLYLVNFENPGVSDLVMEAVRNCGKPSYIQFYSTNWCISVEELEKYISDGHRILYEYIDDISPELAGTEEIPKYIIDKYDYVMDHPEISVVTTARRLYEDVLKKRGKENLAFSCNGVDYSYFTTFDKEIEFGEQFEKVTSNGKINMCYYGALASWFDYDLIKKINETDKYNIILFGIAYDQTFYEQKINKLPNVYYFGAIEYKKLKYYAAKMDILTIPFVINSITLATSPLKLFEYMALHKPIVTTAMDECKNYESVLVANDHDEFIALLDKASGLRNDKDYLELLDKEARDNDWSKKADVIIDLLRSNEQN